MPVTYSTACKNARMQATADEIGNAGKIKIYTTGLATLLCEFTLTSPPESSVTGGVLTFDMDPDLSTTGVAAGEAAEATITTSADTVVVSGLTAGDVGTEEIVLDDATIAVSQTVTMQTGTITHAPDP